jgi:hypothetical protein
VAVISVEQLVSLCQQHAQAPLGLHAYRRLFTSGGLAAAEPVAEDAEEWLRLVHLASAVCAALRSKSAVFGPLSARDLLLILADAPVAEATSEVIPGDRLTLASGRVLPMMIATSIMMEHPARSGT